LVLVEGGPRRGAVEVLQGAASRLRAHELDTVVVAQHANVVAHDAQRGAELQGEITRTGDALAEPLQNACAQRMSESLRDPGLRCLARWSRPITGRGLRTGGHGHNQAYRSAA